MLIDSHCHLDAASFDLDRDAVLVSARARGVSGIVIPAVDRASWQRIDDLAGSHQDLYPAYGLHPLYLDQVSDDDIAALPDWIDTHRCVGIGECGLDFFVEGFNAERQLQVLRPQLALARQRDLPVILHARRALDPLLAEIRRTGQRSGIVHSFSGSSEQARQWCAQGFLLGFGGPVTYERAKRLRRVVAELPIEYLVLETDAPDQPLCGHQGQRNSPELLGDVLDCVAKLRDVDRAQLASATTANVMKLFALNALR